MKSSAISLLHRHCAKLHCVNLVDSPGHVDFSSEVSTAVRLSDGCLILVDAMEGVSAQTHVVLRQAWFENLKPILVLNKVDKLMLERQLDPTAAYYHLQGILAEVNAITSTLFTAELLADEDRRAEELKASTPDGAEVDATADGDRMFDHALEDKDDDAIYFEPSRGNVLFTSAYDGWGFSTHDFAAVLAKKFQCNKGPLQKVLWGDYYIAKEKGVPKVRRGAADKGKAPLFASAVLASIWNVYKAVCIDMDKAQIDKITASMGIKPVSIRDMQSEDRRTPLRTVLGQWMPVSRAVMAAVCDVIPPPTPMHPDRVRSLLTGGKSIDRMAQPIQDLAAELEGVGGQDGGGRGPGASATTLAFVSKMVAVDRDALPVDRGPQLSQAERAEKRRQLLARRHAEGKDGGAAVGGTIELDRPEAAAAAAAAAPPSDPAQEAEPDQGVTADDGSEDDGSSVMMAYTRVFCGRLRRGDRIHVLSAAYNPDTPGEHAAEAVVGDIYVLMGRDLVAVESAPAGMVVGIAGLGSFIQKSATLSSSLETPSLTPMHFVGAPIVRVALETKSIADMPALRRGLKLLHQADPGVQVLIQGSGELVLVAAGEVHIERCVLDLEKLFCPGVEFTISKPIVPLRESITAVASIDMTNEIIGDANTHVVARNHFLLDGMPETVDAIGAVTIATTDKRWSLTVLARPLPIAVTRYLLKQADALRAIQRQRQRDKRDGRKVDAAEGGLAGGTALAAADLDESDVREVVEGLLRDLHGLFEAAGPEWEGAERTILAFGPRHCGPNVLLGSDPRLCAATVSSLLREPEENARVLPAATAAAVVTGFQVITQSGPLAEEPMMGVAFDVVSIRETLDDDCAPPDVVGAGAGAGGGRVAGQVISATKDACKWAFLSHPAQLYTAWYACDLLVTSEMLGKVNVVLTRRNAKILSEEMRLGTDIFDVKALVPVTGSFGFAAEIRLKSSGHASPQLIFSHWDPIHSDPFWVPSTEEELAHYGEKADAPNPARDLLNEVRKRKGLHVEEKIVEFAEKQRTLQKKK